MAADDDKWILDSSLVHLHETFDVTVTRNGLGLGFSIIQGEAGIRIKKIFPLQPAWETGQLRQGDILLKVSGVPLDSLNVREALDVLRSSPPATVLTICRPYSQSSCSTAGSAAVVTRSYSFTPVNTSSIWEGKPLRIPSPSSNCDKSFGHQPHPGEDSSSVIGEFSVILHKVNGSLGFTLKASEDTTVMRHSIKALVKEPALSNKVLQPGDKLISANNVDLSKFSHSELVQFLRHCPETVTLKLYRDASRSQTPITSPDKPSFFEENNNVLQGKMLRYEAIEMVRSLQAGRSSNGGSTSSLNRRKVGDRGGSSLPLVESPEPHSGYSLPPMILASAQDASIQRLQIQDVTNEPPSRPNSLDLSRRRKQKSSHLHFTP